MKKSVTGSLHGGWGPGTHKKSGAAWGSCSMSFSIHLLPGVKKMGDGICNQP